MNRLNLALLLVIGISDAGCTKAPAPPLPPPPPPLMGAAQIPPPARAQAPYEQAVSTRSGKIRLLIYGQQGELTGFLLSRAIAVMLSPDLGQQIQSVIQKGYPVRVTGYQQVVNGKTTILARRIVVNGQTYVAAGPADVPGGIGGPPPPGPPPQN